MEAYIVPNFSRWKRKIKKLFDNTLGKKKYVYVIDLIGETNCDFKAWVFIGYF